MHVFCCYYYPTKIVHCENMANESDESHQPPTRSFRIRLRRVNFTFPRCDVEPEGIFNCLMELFRPTLLVVSQHEHDDKGLHLHAVLVRPDQRVVHTSAIRESVGHYPHTEKTRNLKNSIRYATESELQPSLLHGIEDLEEFLRARKKQATGAAVAAMLDAGSSLTAIYEAQPSFFLHNQRKIRELQSFLRAADEEEKEPWLPPEGDDPISVWLAMNMFVDRPERQAQLYVHGATGLGKSWLVKTLSRFARVYYASYESFQSGYDDDLFDLCVFDEFRAQLPITFMNRWVEGYPCPFGGKGWQGLKRKNIPCIVLSNRSPSQAYNKIFLEDRLTFEAFYARFHVVRVEERIDCWPAVADQA